MTVFATNTYPRLERPGHCFERGNQLSAAAVSKRVVALAKRAGVRLTMRSLRRGFACTYAAEVPAQVLQALMRHRNISTTMAFYANTEAAAAAVRRRNSLRNNANAASRSEDATADGVTPNEQAYPG